jgi:uncharacterized membrane protein YgcG
MCSSDREMLVGCFPTVRLRNSSYINYISASVVYTQTSRWRTPSPRTSCHGGYAELKTPYALFVSSGSAVTSGLFSGGGGSGGSGAK